VAEDENALSRFVLSLPPGYAAIIVDEDGSLVEGIFDDTDDKVMSRGQVIAMMFHTMPAEKLDNLIQEFLMSNDIEGTG
jgi:hypothetical protein